MAADLHETVAERLDGVGQRYTDGRRALVEVLAAADRPLTLPDVLAAARDPLAQSSAYRNLAVLEQAGVVLRVAAAAGSSDHARYELAEDLAGHHHHLVCTRCGSVTDVTVPDRLERAVDRALEEIVAGTGFRLEGHRLDLVGRCRNCA
ncbi:MAG TPA: Fur family transcriptional regulator [Acidimicrobiales bacterium]|nr:Fur family transcriptional regulator [Acidimicrobiales bacterium]